MRFATPAGGSGVCLPIEIKMALVPVLAYEADSGRHIEGKDVFGQNVQVAGAIGYALAR